MNRLEQFKDIARYAFGNLVDCQTMRYPQAVLTGGQGRIGGSPRFASPQPMVAVESAALPCGAEQREGFGGRWRELASEPEVDTNCRVCVGAAPGIDTAD